MIKIVYDKHRGIAKIYGHGGAHICDITKGLKHLFLNDIEDILSDLGIPVPEWEKTSFGFKSINNKKSPPQ